MQFVSRFTQLSVFAFLLPAALPAQPHSQGTLRGVTASESSRFDLAKGSTLPDFTYTAFDGSKHKFSDLGGKYRLIDFWATWCVPCVADLPSKKRLYAKYHAHGLEILGIDAEERVPDAAPKLIAEMGIPWPQAQFEHNLVETRFGVYKFPTLILVDASGRIVSTADSQLLGDALNQVLKQLMGDATASRGVP